jgi:excinuclease ABC subunit C
MQGAAGQEQFELAAKYRDLITTVEQLQEKQRMAAAEGDDADVLNFHFENHMLAVNLFHMRGGKALDRREFFWEDLGELEAATGFDTGEFFSTLLKQLYVDQQYVPRFIYIPVDFEDRQALAELLSAKSEARIHIEVPQRGEKRSLIDLVGNNARQSYDQRFRVLKPLTDVLKSVLQEVLNLAELPERIECFDISHIQGAETVGSMVVWQDGGMRNSEYRKFIIRSVDGIDDFAAMREVVTRRYKRLCEEEKPLPSLILVDGGLGQLHAAAEALESLGLIAQPLASIAKREEIIYVYGQESEPVVLDRHSPVLHLVQQIRDEAHRFAVTYHRKRRQIRDRATELREIRGIGEQTTRRLLQHFGSVRAIQQADAAALSAVVSRRQAEAIFEHFHKSQEQA